MKKIIDGKEYNTEIATKIAAYTAPYDRDDRLYYYEELYMISPSNYFLYGEGSACTRYAKKNQNGTKSFGKNIIPIDGDTVSDWIWYYSKCDGFIFFRQ